MNSFLDGVVSADMKFFTPSRAQRAGFQVDSSMQDYLKVVECSRVRAELCGNQRD